MNSNFEIAKRELHAKLPRQIRGRQGKAAVPMGGGGARTKQKSHIISYGHFWRPPRNVAIATTLLHDLKYPQGNYVRNCLGRSGGRRRGRRARAGFESTRRAKLAAWTTRGRAAAHQHTQRPGPQNRTRGSPRGPPRVHATRSDTQHSRECKHSTQSKVQALSTVETSRTQRSRAATTSATWTALRAAPLRRLSPETTRTRPRLPSTA